MQYGVCTVYYAMCTEYSVLCTVIYVMCTVVKECHLIRSIIKIDSLFGLQLYELEGEM